MRRVTFDLTGLPPTLAELDSFLADKSPDAYEKRVDQLLASPHYGERMAMPWLDLARYADTHGYHIDSLREMWRWRDWVIRAYNQNLPYDQFTIKQMAGDLLPNATVEDKIATGFNRNHMIDFEGGAVPQEYHVGIRGGPGEHHGHGVAGSHDRLRALPRPQVRSDQAERLLPLLRLFQYRS